MNIGTKNFVWSNGRELTGYNDDNKNVNYAYSSDGTRISKTVNNEETKYYLEGKRIIFENRNGDMIYYIYNNEELLGFKYNDNIYYYHKNIFGDIIGIFNDNYNEIAKYDYDSWGNILSIEDDSDENIANINPFRYRSYYYDNETEMYYLKTSNPYKTIPRTVTEFKQREKERKEFEATVNYILNSKTCPIR